MCLSSACISQIIPFIAALKRGLEISIKESEHLKEEKQKMITAINQRTDHIHLDELCYRWYMVQLMAPWLYCFTE